MKVCFCIGNCENSSMFIEKIKSQLDDVEFFTYPTVEEIIKDSNLRHTYFDRIVLSSKFIKNDIQGDLTKLNDYLVNNSDNTKVVLLCRNGDEAITEFNKIFSSPMYTVVISEKVSIPKLVEFIKGDILELKTKYYTLDVKDTKSIVAKSVEQDKPKEVVKDTKVERKKGFFGRLFGGKEKIGPNNDKKVGSSDVANTVLNSAETVANNIVENGANIVGQSIGNTINSISNTSSGEIDSNGNFISSEDIPSLTDCKNSSEESENNLSENQLNLSDYGDMHVDTGFLDESQEQELLKDLKDSESTSNSLSSGLLEDISNLAKGSHENSIVNSDKENEGNGSDDSDNSDTVDDYNDKPTLIIGHFSNYDYDNSFNLLVDLDYKNNRVLQTIDIDDFYASDSNNGINDLKVFKGNEYNIISNGFGVKITTDSINNLLFSGISSYKTVFLCPLDCTNILTEELVENCNIEIHLGGDVTPFSVIQTITSGVVSPRIEDIIYDKAKIVGVNRFINYEDDMFLFSRGNWLNKFER